MSKSEANAFDDLSGMNTNENHTQDTQSYSYAMLEKELQAEGLIPFIDGHPDQFSSEIRALQNANKQLKIDLQSEQDNVFHLRKKVNNVEKQKLEAETRANGELSVLETQVAKLRSQVEKGEATRHNLEYELTVSQRELNNCKQNVAEKESTFKQTTEDMKQKTGELGEEVKRLQQSLKSCKDNADDNEQKSRRIIQELEQQLSKTKSDLDITSNEKNRLNELCQKHSNLISDLSEKLQVFESDKRHVLENLKRATAEIEYTKEREERMKSENEAAFARIKTLEENIEVERASHLETKFNSEIVQLRVRDLDGAIEVEKSANIEANKAIERLTQQNRELEQVYDQERKTRKELNAKMDKMEKEAMTVKRQLTSDVEDKKSVIGNLSKELQSHQKNFNELKTELSKAKKRQLFLEETYGGSIKELEFLMHTFHFDDKKLRMATRKEEPSVSGVKGKKAPLNPSITVENFKQMLIQLKKKLDVQTEELIKAKKNIERLTKDVDSSKEILKNKDRTIEDTQKNYTKMAKDLNKSRANYSELESTIGKLKASLQTNTSNQNKDRNRIQELSEEIMKLVKRHKSEEEDKIAFLHSLYQRLLSGHIVIPTKDRGFNQFSWLDLTEVVFEQVTALIDMVHASDEKLKHNYTSSRNQEEAFASLKQGHEEQITKLTNMARERESSWQRQKEELEHHYNEMISDIQSQSKKNQAIADQAWEKVRATGSVQHGLETEVVELRRELAESQVQASSLLSTCALLSGALYPLYTKAAMLSSQRHILEELFCNWENCRDRAMYLCSVLSSGRESEQDQPERDSRFQRKRSPILRFRMGVIAVLAANRLAYLGANCKKCFVTYNSSVNQNGLGVSTGGLSDDGRKLTAVNLSICNEPTEPVTGFGPFSKAEKKLGAWLTSPELLETVMASMVELQESLRINRNQDNPTEVKLVLNAARTSFTKYIDRLALFFPASSLPVHSSIRERTSLLRKLERPLSLQLRDMSFNSKGSLISSQEVMSSLQNHILDLTQRLHSAEKERQHLLADLSELKQQIGDESTSSQNSSDRDKQSSNKGTKYVSMDKFEKVCVELSGALRREQKAQVLLQEQSNQLAELTSRLDMCASDGVHKEKSLVNIQEGLTEMQGHLRHKDQNLRQIGKQLAHVEYERDTLESNLKDAENALRTAARDKEILAQYIRNVGGALEIAKKQFLIIREPLPLSKDMSLSRLLLDADLIPMEIGKTGPELISLQNLVGGFVDAQHQAVNKIRALEEEITSHRSHINSLKRELSNAVQREFNQQLESATDGAYSVSTDQEDDLVQLKPDNDDNSYENLPTPRKLTPPMSTSLGNPSIQHKKSAFHSVKSSSPRSPRKSPRPSK